MAKRSRKSTAAPNNVDQARTAKLRAIERADWSYATTVPSAHAALTAAHERLIEVGYGKLYAAEILMDLAVAYTAVHEEAEEAAHKLYDDDRNGLGISVSMSTQLMALRGQGSVDTLQDAHSVALMAARVAEIAGADGGSDARTLGRAASLLSELSAGLVTAGLYLLSEEGGRDE